MENAAKLRDDRALRLVRAEVGADVVQPLGDQVLICGIKHVGVVDEQDCGPLREVAFGYKIEAPALKRIGDVLARDDDAWLRQTEATERRSPLKRAADWLQLEMKIEDASQHAAQIGDAGIEPGETPQHVQLRVGERGKLRFFDHSGKSSNPP